MRHRRFPVKVMNAAVSKLRMWREEQRATITQREDVLAAQLRAAVSECLRVWCVEAGDMVVKDLIEYGRAGRKYRRGEGGSYGYEDLREFERRFETLSAAWEDVVDIRISRDGDYRFEVTFTAVAESGAV